VVAPHPRWDHRPIADSAADHAASTRRRTWRLFRQPRDKGPLRRSRDDRVVAGVAGGIGRRFGIDATVVRIGIVLLSIGGGTGIGLYVAAWLLLRRDDEETSLAQRALHDRRATALALALGTLVVFALLVLNALGIWFAASLMWPLALAGAGLVVVWSQADEEERAPLRRVAEHLPGLPELGVRSRRVAVVRTLIGAVLVAAGVGGFLAAHQAAGALREGVLAAAGIVAGFLLVFGPWWLRLGRALTAERRERVREQERADMATHVHDSVLQTLALIQRRADDPREVTRLARAQERELRAWLFEGRPPGTPVDAPASLATALAGVEADVEATHGVAVEAVTVGDCPLDDDLAALVAAGREAAVNAAKWSGAAAVTLFAEVEHEQVSLFVRDRGVGFDPTAVSADRKGITESIRGRLERHGGRAVIRSAPGDGTEVELTMPRRVART